MEAVARIRCVAFVSLFFLGVLFQFFYEENNKMPGMAEFNMLETPLDNFSTLMNNSNSEKFNISTIQKILVELSRDIRKINLYARGVKARQSVRHALSRMTQLLNLTNTTTEGLRRHTRPSEHICGEVFMGTRYGNPLYYEIFKYVNCSYSSSLDKLISIVVLNTNRHIHDLSQFIHSIGQYNKNIKVIVGVSNMNSVTTVNDNLMFKVVPSTFSEGEAWNFLIQHVNTVFTFVAPNITHFSDDVRIDRLVSVIESLNVSVAGGATRDLKGFWKLGCYQSAYQNYSLVYEEGYYESKHECIFCDYVVGPFLARTKTLRKYTFDGQLPRSSVFHDFFLRLSEKNEESVVCPDSMFYTHFEMPSKSPIIWFGLAKKYNLYQVKFADEFHLIFNCYDLNAKCRQVSGFALHPCCIQELTDIVKFIMKVCDDSGVICELHCGTLLGAVKFSKILPWELDADIRFFTANFSTLVSRKSEFEKRYKFWNDSGKTGGIIHVRSANFRVEVYGFKLIDSKFLLETGLTPTKVLVDGQWVYGSRNPGMHVRNKYGREIYTHSQHLHHLGIANLKADYKPGQFTGCKSPGRHDCLDNFNADGDLQFRVPIP